MSILIPVEIRARELEAKLHLASKLAEKGAKILIGRVDVLNEIVPFLPPSIYLAKTFYGDIFKEYEVYRKAGHTIVGLDEEAGIRFSCPKQFFQRRINPQALQYLNNYLTWNAVQKDVFKEMYPEYAEKVITTGSPRIDLLSICDRKLNMNKANKKIRILISSNFVTDGLENNLKPIKQATITSYKKIIRLIAKTFSDVEVYIRPHPNEVANNWIFEDIDNLKVRVISNNESIRRDLINANLLIHCGCTAAVEAAILGLSSIYFDPHNWRDGSNVHGIDLTHSLGKYITTDKGLLSELEHFKNNLPEYQQQSLPQSIQEMGFVLDGTSTSKIVDVLSKSAHFETDISQQDIKLAQIKSLKSRPFSYGKMFLRNLKNFKITPGSIYASKLCPEIKRDDFLDNDTGPSFNFRSLVKIKRNLFLVS